MIDRIGPYSITRELGRGGMGVVYLATDSRLDRQVAIKSLPVELASVPARLERFERDGNPRFRDIGNVRIDLVDIDSTPIAGTIDLAMMSRPYRTRTTFKQGGETTMQAVRAYESVASIGPRIGSLIERHMDRTFRRVGSDRMEIDPRFVRIVTGEAHPLGNFALMADPHDLDATRAGIEPLCNCGAPAAALFVGAVGADVDAVLREAGFEQHGDMPGMAVDIERLAPTSAPEGCVLEGFPAGARDEDWVDAFAAGYEIPRATAAAFSPGNMGAGGDDDPVQFFGVIREGRIVATSVLVLDDGVAGIYCVSTRRGERGRGLGALVTADPLRRARALGYRVGVLQSSEAGYAVYKRLGFADHGVIPLYVRTPG